MTIVSLYTAFAFLIQSAAPKSAVEPLQLVRLRRADWETLASSSIQPRHHQFIIGEVSITVIFGEEVFLNKSLLIARACKSIQYMPE